MTKFFLIACGWAALVLPVTGLSTAPDDKPRVLIAKLGRGGMNQLWLDASVENVKGAMIVDTGAEDTVLSHDKFGFLLHGPDRKLPPGTGADTHVNSMPAKVALARDFRVGGNDLDGTLVSLVGGQYLSDGEKLHYRNRRGDFDGLLSKNFLRRYHAVIDCHRQLLYLSLAAVLPANGWTRVPMADAGSDFTVPCALDGHRFRRLVDTGSAFTTVDKLLGGDTPGFNGAIIDVGEHALYLKHP